MFFSKTARILAIVMFAFGLLGLSLGISALAGIMDEAARARYVGKSPWGSVELGTYIILAAVALGTLAELSFSVRKAIDLPPDQWGPLAGFRDSLMRFVAFG